jgi:hypothetical protein
MKSAKKNPVCVFAVRANAKRLKASDRGTFEKAEG